MIRLEVEPYCQWCLDFTPDVIKPDRVVTSGGESLYTDTIVQCRNHKRCEAIKRYLQQVKGEQTNG